MGIYAQVPCKITDKTMVDHISREISSFSNFFVRYGGVICESTSNKVPQISSYTLEISIYLCIQKGFGLRENIRPHEKLRCRVLHGARKDSNKGRTPGEVWFYVDF